MNQVRTLGGPDLSSGEDEHRLGLLLFRDKSIDKPLTIGAAPPRHQIVPFDSGVAA